MKKVMANIYSDDRVFDLNVDASEWFKHASKDEIIDLIDCDYSHDLGADAIALYYEAINEDVGAMFAYISAIKNTRRSCGFEVVVDQEEAELFINKYHPDILNSPNE